MDLKTTLLRKEFVTLSTGVFREVRVSVIHNQALLLYRDLLAAAGHTATPGGVLDGKRELEHGVQVDWAAGCSIFLPSLIVICDFF
jgi:hypothetical protein